MKLFCVTDEQFAAIIDGATYRLEELDYWINDYRGGNESGFSEEEFDEYLEEREKLADAIEAIEKLKGNERMKELSAAQRRLVELDMMEDSIKKYYEERDAVVAQVVEELGMDGHFQAADGTVFQVVKPKGKFVSFKAVDYIRTKRGEEERGELSAKKAKEWGYTVK